MCQQRPSAGPGGALKLQWATAARGPERRRPPGGGRLGWGHIRQTIQSPKAFYKDLTDYTKPPKDYTKPLNIRQNLKISDKYLKY